MDLVIAFAPNGTGFFLYLRMSTHVVVRKAIEYEVGVYK